MPVLTHKPEGNGQVFSFSLTRDKKGEYPFLGYFVKTGFSRLNILTFLEQYSYNFFQ